MAKRRFALDNGLKLALRGGGHNQAGLAFLPGGVTIDMSELTGVAVDPATAVCRFEARLKQLLPC